MSAPTVFRSFVFVIAVAAVFAVLSLSCRYEHSVISVPTPHAGDVESRSLSFIRAGMTRNDVEQSLVEHGIDFSYRANDNCIAAIRRDIRGNMIVKESMQYNIQFDSNDRVQSISENSVFTGP